LKTALYEEHVNLNGRMVEFAGWQMPVQYQGIKEEHLAVRSSAGLFDVGHMGEILVSGDKALATLEWLTTNDVSVLNDGQAQYSLLPNEKGGLVDDIIIYCLKKNLEYLVCVNAANTEADWAHFQKHNRGAILENVSSKWGQIAIQGPKARDIAAKVFGASVLEIQRFQFKKVDANLVARTGYTGEDGFEVFVPWGETKSLWQKLMSAGGEQLKPCGLGARDTLRTEMKYSLYGQEIDAQTNPYASGLGWVIKPQAKDFLGRGPMVAGKESGRLQKLVGLKLLDKGIPRKDYEVWDEKNKIIGRVTSGTLSPSTGEAIGIAFVDKEHASVGTHLYVNIRNRAVKAEVVVTPFVKT
jgi:aminomethyltransferase